MNRIICFIIFLIILVSACKNKSGASSQQSEDTAHKEYYPISSFINAQLKNLDSLPLAVIKYTSAGNKTDTTVVDKKDFASVAGYFNSPDITAPGIKEQIEETSFIDASIGTIMLTYTAKNDSLPLRKADVLLKQEDSRVRTIYIEKQAPVAGGTAIKKMLWTADRNCLITTINHTNGHPEEIIIEKYVWDDRP